MGVSDGRKFAFSPKQKEARLSGVLTYFEYNYLCIPGFAVAAWVPKGTSAQLPIACISGFPVAAQVPRYLDPGT